jgi:hypothetical protein
MSEFIVEQPGPDNLFGVFEDDGETGYLYIYEPDGRGIITHLHVYDRTDKLNVEESDVQVIWSLDGSKCGVMIWGGMRGIIDMSHNKEGRVWLEDRNTPAISDPEWLRGFSLPT